MFLLAAERAFGQSQTSPEVVIIRGDSVVRSGFYIILFFPIPLFSAVTTKYPKYFRNPRSSHQSPVTWDIYVLDSAVRLLYQADLYRDVPDPFHVYSLPNLFLQTG